MAPQSMLQPDPLERRLPDPAEFAEPEPDDPEAGAYLARLASTLAAHGGGDSSADLALDLVLNEIVEQARLATTATGAAIALLRGESMVCRATNGANAPGLGAPLNMQSGLSGACIRTRQVQRCDDAESDPRVDAAASRELDVRSILVVPVISKEELVGVFELFSPRVGAFSDRDVHTVEALSRRIVHTIQQASETPAAPLAVSEMPPAPADAGLELLRDRLAEVEPETPPVVHRRDRWTDVLNGVVIFLALLLGWMVGRVGWQQATGGPGRVASPAPRMQAAPPPSPLVPEQAAPPVKEKKPPAKVTVPAALRTELHPNPAPQPVTDGLVIYEKGQVIFRSTPATSPRSSENDATPTNDDVGDNLVSLPPEIANTHVLRRVEPTYPEEARQQRLAGAVILHAVVGKDGAVRAVQGVSGDPQLSAAAIAAVRQWQFKPYVLNGSPVAFQTQITLNFTP